MASAGVWVLISAVMPLKGTQSACSRLIRYLQHIVQTRSLLAKRSGLVSAFSQEFSSETHKKEQYSPLLAFRVAVRRASQPRVLSTSLAISDQSIFTKMSGSMPQATRISAHYLSAPIPTPDSITVETGFFTAIRLYSPGS